ALDGEPEEGEGAGVGSYEPRHVSQQHRLAGSAAAHDDERLAAIELKRYSTQHLSAIERLAQPRDLDHGRCHHQKIMRKILVRKKSETITAIVTCTTVAVVARPSPSVPPVVDSPL